MNVPLYARYDFCNIRACEFLEYYQITTFPIDILRIISVSRWTLVPYSELMTKFKCDRSTVIRCLGSKDGYTTYDGENYAIAYNDDPLLGNRIRFTLMHEIGHVFLNHLLDFEATMLYRGALTKTENKILENEANAFARNVLVPTFIVNQLQSKSTYNISRRFGITLDAARTRLDFFEIDFLINDNKNLQKRLKKIFINFYYKKKCTTCQMGITLISGSFCPICGHKGLKWGEGKMKYPSKIKVNEKSKATHCPVCDNEDISPEGEYCQICGAGLINQCVDVDPYGNGCGALAAANARYCIHCGSQTTFYHNGFLKSWEEDTEKFALDEEFAIIQRDWDKIIHEIGGCIRSCLRGTVLESNGENCLYIVFTNPDSYEIGSRPTAMEELERYIKGYYGKEIYFRTKLKNPNERPHIIYVNQKELE